MGQRSFDASNNRQSVNPPRFWLRTCRKLASILLLTMLALILVLQIVGQTTDPPWSPPGNSLGTGQVVLTNQLVRDAQ